MIHESITIRDLNEEPYRKKGSEPGTEVPEAIAIS